MWQCPKCKREFEHTNQDHYCSSFETIDQYISEQDEAVQPILQKIREAIHSAAPEAIEKISWQMPSFWLDENLIHFAAFKKHVSIYPGALAATVFADQLTEYKTSKGTIQFPLNKPVPYDLIEEITRWRVNEARGKTNSNQDTDTRKMTRQVYDIPDYVAAALDETGLWERYRSRPPYQRNDYIGWITRAKREETRDKRLAQMLAELQSGVAYMGMKYNAK